MTKTKKRTLYGSLVLVAILLLAGGLYYATLAGMYKASGKVLSAKWFAQWKLNYPGQITDNNCTATWSPSINGQVPYMLPFYPEVEAAYWMLPQSFDPAVFKNPVVYQLKGQFPYARYMSFHSYDATTGDYVAALKDIEIVADEGSINPYGKGVARDQKNRDYTLWLVPEGASLPQLSHAKNILVIPKGVKFSAAVLRVYRPDESKGLDGGVPLPQVFAFDAQSGLAVNKCAPLLMVTPKSLVEGKDDRRFDRRDTIDPNIRHFRSNGAGFYPNKHNAYLVSEFNQKLGEMAVLKWKAPTSPNTKLGGGTFNHKQQVRYWSYCLGGEQASNTSYCLVDDEAVIDEEGFVNVAMGPDDNELMNKAKKAGINYIPWGLHYRPTTILRHMEGETRFANSIQGVPEVDVHKPMAEQGGELFIGEYSPTGFYCSKYEFEIDFCGIKNFNIKQLQRLSER